jgi:hypothetical protein
MFRCMRLISEGRDLFGGFMAEKVTTSHKV